MLKQTTTAVVALTILSATLHGAEPDVAEVQKINGLRKGLAVHVGTSDGQFEVALAKSGFACVHGLALSSKNLQQARKTIQDKQLYGPVSVSTGSPSRLPYVDNLVNLIVVDLDSQKDAASLKKEISRVLAPKGVAYIKEGGKWSATSKARPKGMDDWTHPFHGPEGDKASKDRLVGPPTGVQWIAGPVFVSAGRKTSTESAVSANGINFFMTQNELSNLDIPEKERPHYVIARDSFNGLLLWKRALKGKPIGRSGAVNPRLVASAEQVFCVEGKHVISLDAATGKPLQSFKVSAFPEKFLYHDGLLIVETEHAVTAFNAKSAQVKWEHKTPRDVSGTAMTADFLCLFEADRDDGRYLVLLTPKTGKPMLRKRIQDGDVRSSSSEYYQIAFMHPKCLGLMNKKDMLVLDVKDGDKLWDREIEDWNYGCVYLQDGLVWHLDDRTFFGLDPITGKEKEKAPGTRIDRCQIPLATPRFVINPRKPPSLIDLTTKKEVEVDCLRGACGFGFLPANGLMYTAPHACRCYPDAIRGFVAMNSSAYGAKLKPGTALERGPAFGKVGKPAPVSKGDWPTFRHDQGRTGWTDSEIPEELKVAWSTQLAGSDRAGDAAWRLRVGMPVSAPVIAGGLVYVAEPNHHRVTALDEKTGKELWSFIAGGRVDTPPTIYRGLCLFGARDGWVYCLRAADGELVWRFRVAVEDRNIVAFGQLESVWPAVGSVVVHDGLAYAAAGRSPEADGGLRICAIDPQTGEMKWTQTLSKGKRSGQCDVLVASRDGLCVNGQRLAWKTGEIVDKDKDDLAPFLRGGPAGMLEASWTRIPLAMRKDIQTWNYDDAYGQLLVVSPKQVWGYHTNTVYRSVRKKEDDVLFQVGKKGWKTEFPKPMQVEALIGNASCLVTAGTTDRKQRSKAPGFLQILRPDDGKSVTTLKLERPPGYDGMAAANGRLYLTTEDGKVICLGSR